MTVLVLHLRCLSHGRMDVLLTRQTIVLAVAIIASRIAIAIAVIVMSAVATVVEVAAR